MNKSPWIFMGVLFALSLSWWGMVYGPASQVNNMSPDLGGGDALKPRVGLAKQGEQVYRESGCYYCHTRTATGGTFGYEIQITQLGDNQQLNKEVVGDEYSEQSIFKKAYAYKAVAKAVDALKAEQAKNPEERDEAKIEDANATLNFAKTKAGTHGDNLQDNLIALGVSGVSFEKDLAAELGLPAEMSEKDKAMVAGARLTITDGTQKWRDIEEIVRGLKNKAGAQFKLQPLAEKWPDVQYGAARRQSVSRDFLFDAHAMPGVMRLGPDLSSVGSKYLNDANGLYAKIYNAQAGGESSHMPTFKYLFNKRDKFDEEDLPLDAVTVVDEKQQQVSIDPGYVVTPTEKAKALVVFLQSLRTDRPLPEAPLVNVKQAAVK